jgi:hypothetical protein
LVQVSLTEQGKVLARNAPFPLQDTLAESIGKLPENGLESLECIVELMQMQHVDAAPILETVPIDAVLRDTGA